MKVVIAGHFTFPLGGAPTARMRNFALGLRDCGAQVHILAMAPEFNISKSARNFVLDFDGITYERLAAVSSKRTNKPLSKLRWFTALYGSSIPAYRRLRQLIKQGECDLFMSYGRNAMLQWALVKLCRKHGIPTILDVTELQAQFSGVGGKLNPIYWDIHAGVHYMPRDFDVVTTITHALKSTYEAMGCKRVMVIPSIEGWENLPPIEHKPLRDVFRLVYVGALIDRDAPDVLLEALRILHARGIPVQLDVIGRYQHAAEGRKRAAKIQADETLRTSVNLIGEVSDQALMELMRNADGLVLLRRDAPTEVAAFPTRLVEYLRQGNPVFVSDVGDIGVYLRHEQDAILLSPSDPAQVAEAIAAVVMRADQGYSLGLQGRERGAECFDRRVYAQKLLEVTQFKVRS